MTALCFHQAPGLVVPDSKLDLTAGPGAFLGRALHMWDPQGAFGQLQNQAYGYLFPVGPFHWLLDLAGVPEWVVQRLWWSLLPGLAFVGYWKLAGALQIGTPWTRYLGALLYALTPRLLGEVAITSVEVWPVAMALVGPPAPRDAAAPFVDVADQSVRPGVPLRRWGERRRLRRDAGAADAVVPEHGPTCAGRQWPSPAGWPRSSPCPRGGWCPWCCSAGTARRSSTGSRTPR